VIGPVPHYEGGQWSTGPDWIDQNWADPPPRLEDACAVRGYCHLPVTKIGMRYGLEIYLWARAAGVTDVPPCLLLVVDGGSSTYLSAGSLPDGLDLMGRWAPLVTADILSDVYDELMSGHGHGILTYLLAAVRANEDDIDREHRRLLGEREKARQQQVRWQIERQRQAMPAGPPTGPPWAS
jgi:hypothetical protein